MPTFVLMGRLPDSSVRNAEERRSVGKQWLDAVHASCPDVKFVAHYALLGPYDFMDIYEAPDVETAHRVALISRARGARTAESWPALHYDEYLRVLGDLQD